MVRLVSLTPPEKETTWRVYFEGVKQPDSIIPGQPESTAATAKLGVNVIWGRWYIWPLPRSAFRCISIPHGDRHQRRHPARAAQEIGICQSDDVCKWIKEDATIYPDTERKLKRLIR